MLKPLFREKFTLEGTWWFQDHPEIIFVGKLKYIANEKIELDISAEVSKNKSLKNLFLKNSSTVFGINHEGEDVTLLCCFSLRTQFKVSGVYALKISANYLLIGTHLEDPSDKLFTKFSFTSLEFISFYKERGMVVNRSKKLGKTLKKYPISYSKPETKSFKIKTQNSKLRFEVVPTFSFSLEDIYFKEVPVAEFIYES